MKVNAKVQITEEMKRNFIIEKLLEQGVKEVDGISLQDVAYDDLKYALVIASYRDIDTASDVNRWY